MPYPEDGPPLRDDEKLDNPAPSVVKKTPEESEQHSVSSRNQSGGITANTVHVTGHNQHGGQTIGAQTQVELSPAKQNGLPNWAKWLGLGLSLVGVLIALFALLI